MRKQYTLLLLLLLPLLAMAQNITVPNNVYFADIHLKLSDGAQQEIQKKVDALHRNQTYFKKKVELADAYFPIIERVFKEEGVPDDFKYLALQESGLIGDAVSTSNAVGYWQFKKEAASDFNLRMDNVVDERRHIIEASRGAARYFKRSNNYYDNWFNALLSYYLGYTGVKNYTTSRDVGAKKMEVTERSHPYILTFLAHKIAYDNFVGKNTPVVSLREMRATPGQSLSEIALATKTDYAELERYNKWLLGNSIPSGKDYYVMIPVRNGNDNGLLASNNESDKAFGRQPRTSASASMVKRNGLNALIARPGDTKDKLALQAGISTRRFLKYNDLHSFDNIEPGAAYYIEPKKTTAEAEFHVVQPGENMQQISQHYGLKLNYLRYKNRMSRNEVPVPGRVLWLQKRRPAATAVEVRDVNKPAMTSAAAPASYSKPAPSTPQPQTAAAAPEHKPKENIFTRFFNSLKGHKKQPEQRNTATVTPAAKPQPATTAPSPVKVTAPAAKQASTVTEEDELVISDTVAVQQETAPVAEPTPSVLYPVTSKATADTTLLQQSEDWEAVDTVNWPVKTPPAAPEQDGEAETAADTIFKEPAPRAVTPAKPRTTAAKPATPAKTPTVAKRDTTVKTQPQPAAKPTRHLVKQGETLYSISRMYAVTVNDITRWNNLGEEPLKMGQELLIAEPLTTPAQIEAPEANAAPAKAPDGVHTVAAHETLYQISKKYNVTLEELRQWNSLSDNAIKPGQQLRVVAPAAPAKASEPAPAAKSTFSGNSTYHTVAPGESMYQISRQYGVTIKDIMEWNNKSDFAVSAGEKLLIRKK